MFPTKMNLFSAGKAQLMGLCIIAAACVTKIIARLQSEVWSHRGYSNKPPIANRQRLGRSQPNGRNSISSKLSEISIAVRLVLRSTMTSSNLPRSTSSSKAVAQITKTRRHSKLWLFDAISPFPFSLPFAFSLSAIPGSPFSLMKIPPVLR